jgi:D-alanine-D-alanine ligase
MASAKRHIPAPLKKDRLKILQNYATRFFAGINGQGMARIDFMIHQDNLYFNEINPIPGSLAFYLWDKSGYPFPKLVTKLLTLGLKAHQRNRQLIKTFESNLLQNIHLSGKKT